MFKWLLVLVAAFAISAPSIVSAGEVRGTRVSARVTTNSTTFVDLLSQSITTTRASDIRIHFTVSFTKVSGTGPGQNQAEFLLLRRESGQSDVELARAGEAVGAIHDRSASIIWLDTARAASTEYTYVVQWRVASSTGTFEIDPDEPHHASLVIQEVNE